MLRRPLVAVLVGPSVAACALVANIEDIQDTAAVIADGGSDRTTTFDTGPNNPDVQVPPPDANEGGKTGCDPTAAFGAPVAIASLNSPQDDSTPRFSDDELTVFIGSVRTGHIGGASVYTAKRPSIGAAFGTPVLLNNVQAPSGAVYHPAVTSNTLSLFLQVSLNGNPTDLYVATRGNTTADFGTPTLVPNVNSGSFEFIPFVTPDASLLLFSSNRGGRYVIHQSVFAGAAFGAATVVPGLDSGNNAVTDTAPVLSADRLTVYFGSTRLDTAAGYKIFVARRTTPTGTFGAPTAVAELNSTASGVSDLPSWLSADDCRMYLSSNRANAAGGGYDIYVATRP